MFRVGAAALHSGLAHSIVILLRAMGTPRQVFRELPRAVAKFSTTSTMEVVESGATSATIRFTPAPRVRALPPGLHLRPGPAHHGADDLRAAARGDRARRVRVRRRAVLRLPADLGPAQPAARPPRAERATDLELTALRGQLRILQSAAHRARGQRRRRHRAGTHPRPRGRGRHRPRLPARGRAATRRWPAAGHSAGLPEDEVAGLAATLLDGGDLGPTRSSSRSPPRAAPTAASPRSTPPATA